MKVSLTSALLVRSACIRGAVTLDVVDPKAELRRPTERSVSFLNKCKSRALSMIIPDRKEGVMPVLAIRRSGVSADVLLLPPSLCRISLLASCFDF